MKGLLLAFSFIAFTCISVAKAEAGMVEAPTTQNANLYCVKDAEYIKVDACNEKGDCVKLDSYVDLSSKIIHLTCTKQGFFTKE